MHATWARQSARRSGESERSWPHSGPFDEEPLGEVGRAGGRATACVNSVGVGTCDCGCDVASTPFEGVEEGVVVACVDS